MIKVKINKPIPGYTVGQVVNVETDEEGTPLVWVWRRRLRDAEIDGCCEVVKPRERTSKKKLETIPAEEE